MGGRDNGLLRDDLFWRIVGALSGLIMLLFGAIGSMYISDQRDAEQSIFANTLQNATQDERLSSMERRLSACERELDALDRVQRNYRD